MSKRQAERRNGLMPMVSLVCVMYDYFLEGNEYKHTCKKKDLDGDSMEEKTKENLANYPMTPGTRQSQNLRSPLSWSSFFLPLPWPTVRHRLWKNIWGHDCMHCSTTRRRLKIEGKGRGSLNHLLMVTENSGVCCLQQLSLIYILGCDFHLKSLFVVCRN